MSQDFMDPEIFADFIIEAKEHLETIEPNLLELEQTPDNLDLLNEIFRPMHSLKGASGFLGLNKINVLAHRAENVMDELRKGKMHVTSDIMDVILSSTDLLRTMIENLETEGGEGDVDTQHVIDTLDALLAGDVPAAAPAPAPAPEPEPEAAAPAAPAADFDATPYGLSVVAREHLDDFLEEAREIIQDLNDGLVALEKNPDAGGETVNDIFRYFHNLKGNSGIVGYKELNGLTHEAETLLNRVRKGEMASSNALIDLLLMVVDMMETLIGAIDAESSQVTPTDTSELLARLQAAVESGEVAAPAKDSESEAESEPEAAPAAPAPAGLDDEDMGIFRTTVEQQLAAIDLALTELQKDAGQKDYVDALFRALTTVQNSAGYMDFNEIKDTAERTAGLVKQARDADLDFSLMLDILHQECGIIKDMITKELGAAPAAGGEELVSATDQDAPAPEAKPEPKPKPKAAPKPEPKPAPKPEPKPKPKPEPAAKPAAPAAAPAAAAKPDAKAHQQPKASSTIRVDHEKLDHLMNLIGELIINRNRFAMLARNLEEGGQTQDISEIASNLTETTYSMARISDDLQDTIMKVRMMPVKTVFARFPRLVRDLSRKSGKKVELIMEGEETELDKSVIEEIGDPLVHLIRNSVDHGLETNEQRGETEKPEVGRVWLRAYHQGNSVAIEVEDDGRGIDPEKMRQVGVKKGLVSPEEAKALDDQQAIELIFEPGFSGAEKITDISGRGVGMDVVKTNIKNLKGSIMVDTKIGRGTRFTMALPLTLAIIDALMIKVSGDTYAIPLEAVSETTKIETRRLTEVNGRKAVTLRGEVLGIMDLYEILDLPPNTEERSVLPIVVIQDNNRRLGLVVDSLLERQEIVIKPLGEYLGNKEGISGATIMGDGSVVLILDPHEIYRMST
ncbi:Hpt domain-containing protein [Desulfocurvus sp. DL9XJH121]